MDKTVQEIYMSQKKNCIGDIYLCNDWNGLNSVAVFNIRVVLSHENPNIYFLKN